MYGRDEDEGVILLAWIIEKGWWNIILPALVIVVVAKILTRITMGRAPTQLHEDRNNIIATVISIALALVYYGFFHTFL